MVFRRNAGNALEASSPDWPPTASRPSWGPVGAQSGRWIGYCEAGIPHDHVTECYPAWCCIRLDFFANIFPAPDVLLYDCARLDL